MRDTLWIRRWLRRGLYGLVGAFILLLIAVAAIQTPPGKAALARGIAHFVNRHTSFTLEINGLSGWLPGHARIASIHLVDARGPFLDIEGLDLRLSSIRLVAGDIRIGELDIDRMKLWNRPVPKQKWRIPRIPQMPVWPYIERLNVHRLELGEAVMGREADLTITGKITPIEGAAFPEATLEITGSDSIRASFSFGYDDGLPQLSLKAYDEGLLPAFLDVSPPLVAQIDGRGGRADWTGKMTLTAGEDTLFAGDARLMEKDDSKIQVDLMVNVSHAPFLKDHAAYLGDRLDAHLAAALDGRGLLAIDSCNVASESFKAFLNGAFQLEQKRADLALHLEHTDISKIPGMDAGKGVLPAELDLKLNGAFEKLDASIQALVNKAPVLEAKLHGGMAETVRVGGVVTAYPGRLSLVKMPYKGEEALQIDFECAFDEQAGDVQVERADLSAAGVRVGFQGRYAPDSPELNLKAHVEADDLATAGALLGLPLKGAVGGDVEARGNGSGLEFALELEGKGLEGFSASGQQAAVKVKGRCREWQTMPPAGTVAEVSAQGQGLMFADRAVGDWNIAMTVDGNDLEKLKAQDIVLTDNNARIGGEGVLGLSPRTLDLTLNADIASLAKLPVELNAMPDGLLKTEVSIHGTFQPLALEMGFDGTLSSLDKLPGPVAALAGKEIKFGLESALSPETVTISTLKLSSAFFTAEGTASYAMRDGTVLSDLRMTVPDLKPLGAAWDKKCSGKLAVETAVRGTVKELSAHTDVHGSDIVLEGYPVLQMKAVLDGAGLSGTSPAVTIEGLIEGGGETLHADGVAKLETGQIVLAPVKLQSGANQISGRISYNLKERSPEAELEVLLKDLEVLGRLAGMPCAGSADGRLDLHGGKVGVAMTARDVAYENTRIKSVSITSQLENKGKGYSGLTVVEASDAVLGKAKVKTAKLDVDGGMGEAVMTAAVDGNLEMGPENTMPVTLRMKNRLFPGERSIIMEETHGVWGEFDYSLDQPAKVTFDASGLTLNPMTLRFGTGLIHLEGNRNRDVLAGRLQMEAFPLAVASAFGASSLSGTLDGDVTLEGNLSSPVIRAAISIDGVRMPSEAAENLAPLSAHVNAALTAEGLETKVQAEMKDVLRLESRIALPVKLSIQPATVEFPENDGLSGTVAFDVYLEKLIGALGLTEHYLDGKLSGAFTLAGGVRTPDLRGKAEMRGAAYENTRTGTRLQNLNVTLEAEGDKLRLTECTADMGGRENMSADGEVRLLYEEQFPFKGAVRFSDARFADLDYLNGRVSGAVNAEGTLKDMLVKGDIKVTPVEVSIPEELPVKEPPVLDVTEIRNGQVVQTERKDEPGFADRVRLDINCDIPGKVYARAPILDSEWGGKLHVGGTLAQMKIDGRVAVLRGYLDFLNRRFVLRDSALLFLDGSPEKPYLDMMAVVETSSLSAKLTLKGELDDVKIALSSEPVLPQDEILAQILFGRNLSRLSPVQAIQMARVAAMFNQGLAGVPFFSGNIKLPGIDRFDLRTGERADETAVGMGKYFTDSVYVEVEQGTTTDSGKVSVEVEVTPQISVKGDADAKERSGVGLFWKKDY